MFDISDKVYWLTGDRNVMEDFILSLKIKSTKDYIYIKGNLSYFHVESKDAAYDYRKPTKKLLNLTPEDDFCPGSIPKILCENNLNHVVGVVVATEPSFRDFALLILESEEYAMYYTLLMGQQ